MRVRAGRLLAGVGAVVAVLAPAAPQPAAAVVATGPVRYLAELAPGVPVAPAGGPIRVVQLNLCNSGFAPCYTGGRSVPEAVTLVAAQHPDVLTLNEICRADAERALTGAMVRAWPGEWVFAAFQPAGDAQRHAPLRCRNGDEYGVAVLGHAPASGWSGAVARGGNYPMQDARSTEQRAWVCLQAVGRYRACTTHLAAGSGTVALAQCRHLLDIAVRDGGPLVVAGDLNLARGGAPDVRDCVPPGWSAAGDGDVQHVLTTGDFAAGSTRGIPLRQTDHPAWLLDVEIG
jgi:endonuclease/exonuclease/phosphatase family metal-dependent hydrolase